MKLIQYIWKTSFLKIFNSKCGTFALVMLVTCWTSNQPTLRFIDDVNYPISWCIFPALMSSFSFLILFWFGIIYINSDVPFMQQVNMYQVLRTGRKRWAAGQIGGICLRSLWAVLFTVVCTILPLLPHLELTSEWGKLLRTIASTDAIQLYDLRYYIPYEVMNRLSPISLMVISVTLCTLICIFLGVLMFLICLYSNRLISVSGATAFAISLFFVINMHPKFQQKLAFFVPTIWAEVARVYTPVLGYYWLPPIPYMYGFLLVSIILMSLLIIKRVNRIEFNWENGDI